MEFTIYNLETVPQESKQALAHAEETFGFIPNLEGILAEAPALLKASVTLWDLFETTSFTEVERQVIYLTANYENNCDYCMAAHSGLAKMIGMSQENVEALRNGTSMPDKKLQALRRFTQQMVQTRGWVKDNEIEEFMAAGYSKQQVLEVILGIAIKVIHNYTNHIAKTPLDKQFKPNIWLKPDTNSLMDNG
ncbi:MAG: carboxymuconolactone decarboxylase family protein [Trichodesmium sp. MO_231.B1]|nr:carboxymuconolactone decarboxylase family protein [Trichodesmium sp. MO_231.B1]